MRSLLLTTLAVFSSGCRCDEDPGTRAPTRDRAGEEELVTPEAPAAAPSPWPTEIEGLGASLDAYESIESCAARLRARMPVEVAEGLMDLSYDEFVGDTCGAIAAVAERSVGRCMALSVSTARRGCLRRLAMVTASPDTCPDDPVVGGREPVCLAWATRDEGLCRGAARGERDRCIAVLRGDAEACREGDETCAAAVQRYADVLGDDRAESDAADVEPRFELTARLSSSRADVSIERDVLDRGVHVEARGCQHVVTFADPLGERPGLARRPTARVEVTLPATLELPAEIPVGLLGASLTVEIPDAGRADSVASPRGHVTLARFALERGAAVEMRVDADLTLAPGRVQISGDLATFVRDVDPLPSECP